MKVTQNRHEIEIVACMLRLFIDRRDVFVGGVCCEAEDGIRDLVRSRGLGDVYKRQQEGQPCRHAESRQRERGSFPRRHRRQQCDGRLCHCLLYTSDAADERSSVDLGGRRIIKKTTQVQNFAQTTH